MLPLMDVWKSFDLLPLAVLGDAAEAAATSGHSTSYYVWMLVAPLCWWYLTDSSSPPNSRLVKARPSQLKEMIGEGRRFAKSASWLHQRMDHSLSACQLGITMASLGLGWVGEPAFAHLIEPVMKLMNFGTTTTHVVAFIIAFSIITSLHLVIGEQAPKIFAIREPIKMLLWCAAPMRFFYYLLFPFMYALNWITNIILRWIGLTGETGHGSPHNEDEIRALLAESHTHGLLSRGEHRLINAVFDFDDLICRLVMVPRGEVQVMDVNVPFPDLMKLARETKHTRYPVVDGSLDNCLGVVHMKDLLGIDGERTDFDIRTVMRSPTKVPDTMPIIKVLRHFQSTHQLLSLVVDEYGAIGIVTLENVLEKIVGPVDDEFDTSDEPDVQKLSDGNFLVLGATHISRVEQMLGLNLDDDDADTLAGVLMSRSGKIPEQGDKVEFDGATAEIVEVRNDHAAKVRFRLSREAADDVIEEATAKK